MKKQWTKQLVILFVAIAGLFLSQNSFAGMVGAPAGPLAKEGAALFDLDRLNIGAETDWIFDKDMVVADRTGEKIASSEAYRARIGYVLLEHWEIYGLVGMADMELESTDSTGDHLEDDYDRGLQWGGGLSSHWELPEEWWNLRITVDGQFTGWESEIDHSRGTLSGTEVNSRGEILVRNYHAAVTIGRAYSLERWEFTPYLGVRWSQMTIEENDRDSDNLIIPDAAWRADDHIGLLLGVSAQLGKIAEVSVEGRLVDETAVAARVRCRF